MRATSALLLYLCTTAAAQNGPAPIAPELRARFGFLGPYIQKIGDGIEDLRICDLDGDGRNEVLINDARRARLVALRCKDGEISQQTIPTDGQIAGYVVAGVRGDGKPQLLLIDSRGRLRVCNADGSATAGEAIDLGLGGRGLYLVSGDLDGDGAEDLVVFSKNGLRWVTHLGSTPRLSPIEPLDDNTHSAMLADCDGDGKLDLACIVPGPSMNLRLRRGHGDGSFGPWQLAPSSTELRHVFATRLDDGKPLLCAIEGPQRRVALYRYGSGGGRGALEWWAFRSGGRSAPPFVVADVDGDGRTDVVVAQPEGAELLLFLGRDHGGFAPRTVPTLAGISSMATGDLDGDGKLDLVVTSPEEDALAWKSGALPLDAFPVRLPCQQKPVAVTVDGDGRALLISRSDKREARVEAVRPGGEPEVLAELGRLQNDPQRLLLGDFGDAAGMELAFVVGGDGLRVLSLPVAAADGAAKPTIAEPAGFTKKIEDGSLAATTVDGHPALLVVRERFLRAFRVDAEQKPRVLRQDNGPAGIAEMSLAAPLPDGGCLYLDRKGNKLYSTSAAGAVTSVDVPPIQFTHLLALDDAALLLGPTGLLRVPFGDGPQLTAVAVHEPPTDRTHYWNGGSGDLDGDGRDDLAMLDGDLPGLQILTRTGKGLQRALAVPVFETPPREGASSEPRELRIGDVDGDGRADLVLVAHDRILIYPQEK